MRAYVELRTTFFDENATRTVTVKYIVLNTPSAYNLLLGRPSLNRLGTVTSTAHMKLKLPSPEGRVITMKLDQKMARKCYENNLRNRRGTYKIITQMGGLGVEIEIDPCNERRLKPTREVQELEINSKKFKLGASLRKDLEDKIVEVISKNMNSFTLPFTNMPGIDRNFLCHCLTMTRRLKPSLKNEEKSTRRNPSPYEKRLKNSLWLAT